MWICYYISENLEHYILLNDIMAHWAKVMAILEMSDPTDLHTFKSFIPFCNYYRIYVQDFSIIAQPFYALFNKKVTWTCCKNAQQVFNLHKQKLAEYLVIRRCEYNKVFILHTNWSVSGIGIILDQHGEERKEYVIAYAPRSNNRAKSN